MSINSHDGKQPSVAELQNFVRTKRELEILAVDGSSFKGVLKWFDLEAFCLVKDDGSTITLLKRNILGYGPLS
tara:strand:+ start:99 stop:317 length:219 start_codon:yes stop_codon:yes gene_type:complete